MTIPHFAAQQNLVFVPALLALLVATLAVCLPIVFAQALRKSGPGRVRAVAVVSAVVAAVALVLGGVQGGSALRTLQNERGRLQADAQARYGLQLTPGESDALIDGDAVPRTLPALAAGLGLDDPEGEQPLRLVPAEEGADAYDLTFGGKPLRPSEAGQAG